MTLKEKEHTKNNDWGVPTQMYYKQDVKNHLTYFYNDYWKTNITSDKGKSIITCDKLDYLLNKHFGKIIEIETLQELSKN